MVLVKSGDLKQELQSLEKTKETLSGGEREKQRAAPEQQKQPSQPEKHQQEENDDKDVGTIDTNVRVFRACVSSSLLWNARRLFLLLLVSSVTYFAYNMLSDIYYFYSYLSFIRILFITVSMVSIVVVTGTTYSIIILIIIIAFSIRRRRAVAAEAPRPNLSSEW